MSEDFIVNAELRDDLGKGASRRLRHEGTVPAVIYGAGEAPVALTLNHNEMIKHLDHESFYSHILTIKIGGKDTKAVLKDLQRHPAKPFIMHADFLRVSAKEKLRMNVPLHFIGEDVAPGVKTGGGIVTHNMNDVEVSCLPGDLPEFIEVDVSKLEMDESIHLTDLKLPKGVELVELGHGEGHDQPVAAVHAPRAAKESASAAAESEEVAGDEGEE